MGTEAESDNTKKTKNRGMLCSTRRAENTGAERGKKKKEPGCYPHSSFFWVEEAELLFFFCSSPPPPPPSKHQTTMAEAPVAEPVAPAETEVVIGKIPSMGLAR